LVFFDRKLHLPRRLGWRPYQRIISSIPIRALLLHPLWPLRWLIKLILRIQLHLLLFHNLFLRRHTPRRHRTWNSWLFKILNRLGIGLLLLYILLIHCLLVSCGICHFLLLLHLLLVLILLFNVSFLVYLDICLFLSGYQILLSKKDVSLDASFGVHVFHSPLAL